MTGMMAQGQANAADMPHPLLSFIVFEGATGPFEYAKHFFAPFRETLTPGFFNSWRADNHRPIYVVLN